MSESYCPTCGLFAPCPTCAPKTLALVSTADTKPLDNTNTDDDLALDRLNKLLDEANARGAALVVENAKLRGQLEWLNDTFSSPERGAATALQLRHLCDFKECALQRHEATISNLIVERDAARTELAATKAGADHLQTSLKRARAELEAQADYVKTLRAEIEHQGATLEAERSARQAADAHLDVIARELALRAKGGAA